MIRATAATLALLGLAGCLDLKTTADACSISVAPATITLPVNGASTIIGTAFDCKGNSIRNKKISYSSSNTAVATVTTEGNVIAVGIGGASVSANADGKSASVQVTVTPEAANTVTLTPATLTLRRTNTRQLTATARNNQNIVITGRTFRWASSNSAVISVDQNGLLTALAPGQVVISAEADQAVGSASVTVTEIPIGSCSLAPNTPKLTVTQSVQTAVTLRDTANNVISSLGRQIAWTSDNEVAATVSNTGLVTARRAGTARITASPVEYPQASCTANVEAVDARIVTARITTTSGSLRLGIPRQFQYVLSDSLGGSIPAGRVVSWTSLTPTIATVNANGLVTAFALGTARIVLTAEGVADTVPMSVTRVPVSIIRVSPSSNSVVLGNTAQLSATVEDSTGTTITDRTLEWTSSDASRATVSGTGLVSTLGTGSVTIRAATEDRSGTATVTILQVPADSVVASSESFPVSVTPKQISFRVIDAAGNDLLNRPLSLQTSNGSITGSVNASAQIITVNAAQVGTTTFTLRALNANGLPEGKTTRITVTITGAP